VGQVDNVHHAKDQRETHRRDAIDEADQQAVDEECG
jgi:hypothetical protein